MVKAEERISRVPRSKAASAPFSRREEERLVADVDAAIDRHPAAAAQQVGVGGEEVGQARETIGRSHSCKMYSIVDPSEALNVVLTQRPRSSNHWSLVTVAGIAIVVGVDPAAGRLHRLAAERRDLDMRLRAVLGVEQGGLADLAHVPVAMSAACPPA